MQDWLRADLAKYKSPTAKMPVPPRTKIEAVDAAQWMDQVSACAQLQVGHGRLRILASGGRVKVVLNEAGEYGVERGSVELEAERRRNVRGFRRLKLAFGDLARIWFGL